MKAASVQLFGAPGMTPQALTGWSDVVPAHQHNVNRNALFEVSRSFFGAKRVVLGEKVLVVRMIPYSSFVSFCDHEVSANILSAQ